MDKSALARLAFWAFNMTSLRDAGMSWFGFSYTNPEWERMSKLSQAVTPGAYMRFLAITTLVFIALAAIAVVGMFVPILSLLYPDMSQLKPLPFALLLAATALLAIGVGLPLSMRLATALSADNTMRAQLAAAPGDAELAGKVSRQIWRMTIIMCGLLVPGMLLWIAYDIQGGPLISALKWLGVLLMAGSVGHAIVTRPRRS
jgi:hypothetical protein